MKRLLAIFILLLLAAPAYAQSDPIKFDSQASDNSNLVVPGAVQMRMLGLFNTTTTIYWLKLYDKVTAPVCGTDKVVWKVPIPYGASNAGGGAVIPVPDGLRFFKGLGFCLTANQADTDDTNAATGVALNFGIKQ